MPSSAIQYSLGVWRIIIAHTYSWAAETRQPINSVTKAPGSSVGTRFMQPEKGPKRHHKHTLVLTQSVANSALLKKRPVMFDEGLSYKYDDSNSQTQR